MPNHHNDNIRARTIEPFHRLYAEGLLHKSKAVNDQLFYIGQRYAKSYEQADRILIQTPEYAKPMYDAFRDVPITEAPIDRSRPYYDAAKVLDALGVLEVVEAIVIHGRPVVEAGKQYTGRRQDQQARCAAITALGIGLLALRGLYCLPARADIAA
jgi:hypothetical protein